MNPIISVLPTLIESNLHLNWAMLNEDEKTDMRRNATFIAIYTHLLQELAPRAVEDHGMPVEQFIDAFHTAWTAINKEKLCQIRKPPVNPEHN